MKRSTCTLVFLCIVLIFAGGCSVHRPETISLSMEVPDRFTASAADPSSVASQDRWWEVFEDEDLNALMEKVFAENLDIAQAFSRLKQVEALVTQNKAIRYPSLSLDGSASRTKQPGFPQDTEGESYSLSLGAVFEVDPWNKLKSRHEAQEFQKEASIQDIQALYLTLSAEVAELYYVMVEQRAQLELTDQTIATRKATVELVERRYIEGTVSALDVYQARQTLASVRSRRLDYATTLAVSAHALSILMGEYPDPTLGGTLSEIPDVPVMFPCGLPSELLTRRPDIQAEIMRLKAKDQEIGAAVADRFPSINLLGDYGQSESDFGTSISGTAWNVIGSLTLPLIDWGRRKAEVERTRAVFEESLERYRMTVLNAFREVEDALVRNRNTEEAIKWVREEELAAGAALELASANYMDGLSDYLPVLTAQITHFDAQTRLLSSRRQLISYRISLARALGGSWMDNQVSQRINRQEER